MWRGLLLAFV
jgi:hypothetical protein